MALDSLTRRDFLRYAANLVGVTLLPIAIDYGAKPAASLESESRIGLQKQKSLSGFYFSDIRHSSALFGDKDYIGTLEFSLSEQGYLSWAKIVTDDRRKKEVYSHLSVGQIQDNKLLPNVAIIKRNAKFYWVFGTKDNLRFEFTYNQDGKLIKLTKSKDGTEPITMNKGIYGYHTDFLTTILQQLLDLRDRRQSERLEFIDNSGRPINGNIFVAQDESSVVVLLENFYFKEARVAFTDSFQPGTASVDAITAYGISLGSIEILVRGSK